MIADKYDDEIAYSAKQVRGDDGSVDEAMDRLGVVTEQLQKAAATVRMRMAKVLRPEDTAALAVAPHGETGVELVDRLFSVVRALEGVREELNETDRRCAL